MAGIIKEEFFTTIKKKRFIVLTALLFISAVVAMVATKNKLMNDLTFMLKVRSFMMYIFDTCMGLILLFSVHRRKYTKSSIIQSEEHGVKRSTAVLGRAVAGSLILLCSYLLMFVLLVILGLILGAHLSSGQILEVLLKTGASLMAAVTIYIVSLFFQYLFAFPLVPMLVYFVLMAGLPGFFEIFFKFYAIFLYKYGTWVSAKCAMDVFYTTALLSAPQWTNFLICFIQIAAFLLLTMLVFKLKIKERKKKKKKGEEEETVDPEIKEILEQAELTEDFVE